MSNFIRYFIPLKRNTNLKICDMKNSKVKKLKKLIKELFEIEGLVRPGEKNPKQIRLTEIENTLIKKGICNSEGCFYDFIDRRLWNVIEKYM